MPIVAVYPGREMRGALGGGVVDVRIGPLALGGLDEAFGFVVGAERRKWPDLTRPPRSMQTCGVFSDGMWAK